MLKIEHDIFPEVLLIENNSFIDKRGSFYKIFEDYSYIDIGLDFSIKQINLSNTLKKNTFRGFHFQHPPFSEIKGIQCLSGEILDIFIDIRRSSKTYLKHGFAKLNMNEKKTLVLPKGFAHGFITLTDNVSLLYLHDQVYNSDSEGSLNVFDPLLNINLPIDIQIISDRDKNHPFINNNFNGITI